MVTHDREVIVFMYRVELAQEVQMKAFYVISGMLGGLIVSAYITYLIFARFHRIALLNDRFDVQTGVLIVLGLGASLLAIPIGIALGVLVAAAVNRGLELFRRKRPVLSNPPDQPHGRGASWVTRRNAPRQNGP